MSICTSVRFIYAKFPHSLLNSKTQIFNNFMLPKSTNSLNLSSFRTITIERLPAKPLFSSPSSPSNSEQPVEELPPKLQDIVKLFQAVEDPKAKYAQLLFYGKNLTPLDTRYKILENKVQGCVSQVWVRAYLESDGESVVYEADSDSVLTKGLAALLVKGLSGQSVEEILRVSPDFIVLLGLQQSLTPSRNNGFLNMLKLMQKKAFQLNAEKENSSDLGVENPTQDPIFDEDLEVKQNNEEAIGDLGSISDSGIELGKRGKRIKEMLERELRPMELEVVDISYQHAGHAGVRGSDGETHFNVKVVSKEFEIGRAHV